jgi:hypothetical protein
MQKTLPIQEEYRQLNRGLTEKVLDRAASDPQWKQQFLDDQETAMRKANFPEYQRLAEMSQPQEAAEVSGHEGCFTLVWTVCETPTVHAQPYQGGYIGKPETVKSVGIG